MKKSFFSDILQTINSVKGRKTSLEKMGRPGPTALSSSIFLAERGGLLALLVLILFGPPDGVYFG